ncbi:hypothetical protein SynROS8604_03413 [Synechococcus sp. ROS8604]|nr:hypothetical protein SynROS8604_03413 [Synechococcus sp. ROS8604]
MCAPYRRFLFLPLRFEKVVPWRCWCPILRGRGQLFFRGSIEQLSCHEAGV